MNILRRNLNLLVALDALLAERHVTRAAEKVGITQSAMSNALNQLRDMFQDELLVRGPKRMIPTTRALELAPRIHTIIEQIEELVAEREGFNPQTSERVFTLGMSDYSEFVLLPGLANRLQQLAPKIKIHVKTFNILGDAMPFESGQIELGIGFVRNPSTQLKSQRLFSETAICAAREDHPLMQDPLTLEQYIAADHLTIAYVRDNPIISQTDDSLKKLGLKRNIAISVPHMLAALHILPQTQLLLTIPLRIGKIFAKKMHFALQTPPFQIPPVDIALVWHRQLDQDKGHQWLRNLIQDNSPG